MNRKATSLKALGGLFVAGALALSSCQEVGPDIVFTAPKTEGDTTFLALPESPQPRRILVEDATGVKCSNCPRGSQTIDGIGTKYPGRVIAVGLHAGGLTTPFSNSKYDFRFTKADALLNGYFGEAPNKPAACLSRTQTNGKYFVEGDGKWPAIADGLMTQPQVANITLTSNFTESSRTANITMHVAFVQPVSEKLSLSLFLLEDKIIDPQEIPGSVIQDYEHNHVLRDIITPVSGMPLLDSIATKEMGRVFESKVSYTLAGGPLGPVPANCRLVAFIHINKPDNHEVLQVAEVHLK